jgi:hypothetical protein
MWVYAVTLFFPDGDLGARQTTVSEGGMQKQRVIRGKQMANHRYGVSLSNAMVELNLDTEN